MADSAGTFAPQTMIYTATVGQIWHEMQRQRTPASGHAMFTLQKDPDKSPYRYRGVAVFRVSVALSWLPDIQAQLVTENGRLWLPTWAQFAAALPALAGAGAGVVVSVVLDAPAVAWAYSASRDAKRTMSLATAKATWPSTIAALRAEWEPRRKTARRTRYLAAADALQGAIEFDQARGAV